ncbi:type I-E CRISPR-associated protein Cse2/CasB [Methylobacterium thuringiense]|uniref:CRISPR system Cascade subunit CasB n=1 Tax=Methylobacterium thuringiense TaxID=1003091 RepID=A0ABQ4TTU4_9HYPH|nr:type I-E CRISPR-associated protein Cse2/CasB [Methylobacterium thuringiense]GJE57844.1 hypothetical protein EKPJFOCH_4366 [Methylobacterium thuringiense]
MPETVDYTQRRTEQGPGAVALSIAGSMKAFGNGEMAALRRLGEDLAVPAYWRLAARHDALHARREAWMPIVRALALLTPKGPREERGELHDPKRRLGTALCDGGDLSWPGTLTPGAAPRPLISEARLAQLLAARGRQRAVLLTRAVRALANSRDVGVGLDVDDLAWRFLDPDPEHLAAPYYARLDRAAIIEKTERARHA